MVHLILSGICLLLCITLQHVKAADYCPDIYGGTSYCTGFGAYCCYSGYGCCYNSWYSFWWIWFIIVIILASLSACCGYYRRRRFLAQRGGAIIVSGPALGTSVYGEPVVQAPYPITTAGQYGYTAPVPPPGYSNPGYIPPQPVQYQQEHEKNLSSAPPPSYSSLQTSGPGTAAAASAPTQPQ